MSNILKSRIIIGNHHLWARNVVDKKIVNDCDQQSLKRLEKSNWWKTTVQLRVMFNCESKNIQCQGNQRDWDWTAMRKSLISEANWRKILQFERKQKDWTLEQWKKAMWSDEPRLTLLQRDGCIRVRKEAV